MSNDINMGRETSFYVNTGTYESKTWTEIDQTGDMTFADPADKVAATPRAAARNGFKISKQGLKDWSVKGTIYMPAAGETNTAYSALLAAQKAQSSVEILVVKGGVISTNSLDASTAVCGVFGWEEAEPVEGVTTIAIEMSPVLNADQDYPYYGSTLDSEFVAAS